MVLRFGEAALPFSDIGNLVPHYLEITECALLMPNTFMSTFTRTQYLAKILERSLIVSSSLGLRKTKG